MEEKLSVIVLTFNSIKYIDFCLQSLFNQDYQNFEVIVVDNGSNDGTVHYIREKYPQVNLIENKENLGAAKARNQGIEVALGSWILTLDCDILLGGNFVLEIVRIIKKLSPKVAIIQPKILQVDTKTIYSTGISLSFLRRFHDIGKGKIDNGEFNSSKYIFGACAATAVYNRQMLEEIKEDTGYFDERFFFLVEDVDLAWRVQKKNWKTLFYPEAVCYHIGDSSDTPKKIRQYLCFRNRYFMILKNLNATSLCKFMCFSIIYDIPRMLYLLLTNRLIIKALNEIIGFYKSL